MGIKFWLKRFLFVFIGAFLLICAVQFLKRGSISYAVEQGLIWAGIAAAVFTTARIYQSHKGQHCAICKGTPEMRQASDQSE